jgi:preprotein translocase subunit SecE
MAAEKQMAKNSPIEFAQQVRQEFYKITWPTRKETTVTTAMVFVMVILAAIFFLISDWVIGLTVDLVLGIGR